MPMIVDRLRADFRWIAVAIGLGILWLVMTR